MAFYINLDTRTDRRDQIEAECARMSIAVERFPACRSLTPPIGCTLSHLTVLKLARERGLPSVLVFEDDFEFLVSKDVLDDVLIHLPEDYDVVMLSYNLLRSEPYNHRFVRVLEAQTASGYIVHSRMYDRLIATLEEGYQLFLANPHVHWLYINDQYWKRLQPESRWYATTVRMGKQRPGWSDLGQKFVDNQV
jgi:glycosyl transferase family 25